MIKLNCLSLTHTHSHTLRHRLVSHVCKHTHTLITQAHSVIHTHTPESTNEHKHNIRMSNTDLMGGLMCWRQREVIVRCCRDVKGLLPIARTWLGVALAVRRAVSGIGIGTPGWRGGTWWWGVSGTGLVTGCGLRGWRQAVVCGLLRGLGCVVLRREGSGWILSRCLGSRRL